LFRRDHTIAITRPSSGTFLPRRPPSSYPFLVAPTRRCGLLAASGAHPPGAIPTRPYLGGSLTRDARLLGPSRPAREATSLREVPASLPLLAGAASWRHREHTPQARSLLGPTWVALSHEMPAFLALLARPGRPPPYARCQPPCPYSPAPGRPPPTRGASLLGPTRAASQGKLLSYSPLLPPTRGGARAAPSAPSCPFSPRACGGLATPPGQGAALLGPT
jgi:hypothetical protein